MEKAINPVLRLLIAIGLAVAIAGCGPSLKRVKIPEKAVRTEREKQREIAFSILQKRQDRLLDVSYPLLVAATALCKDTAQTIYGFELHNKEEYGNKYKEVAARYYGLGDQEIAVRYVHPKLSAASAGLRVGDRVLAINGQPLGKKKPDAIMKIMHKQDPLLHLRIERQTQTMELDLQGIPACPYRVRISDRGDVNAFADGRRIVVTTGMVRFAETDEELAMVVGHEIAHNTLRHTAKRLGYILTGVAVDLSILVGRQFVHNDALGVIMDLYIYGAPAAFVKFMGQAFSQTFEAEADYAGLYVMARAGYDITQAPKFWRHLSAEYPRLIEKRFTDTHPSTPERFLAIEQTVREIEEKRQHGEPLLPDKFKAH